MVARSGRDRQCPRDSHSWREARDSNEAVAAHGMHDLVGGPDRPDALGIDDEVVKVRIVDVLVEEPLDELAATAVRAADPSRASCKPTFCRCRTRSARNASRRHDPHGEGLRPRQNELRPAADKHRVAGSGQNRGSSDRLGPRTSRAE